MVRGLRVVATALLATAGGASCSLVTSFDGFAGDAAVEGPPADDGGNLDAHAPPRDGGSDSPADAPPASVYRSTILADTPLAYWRFGEGSGAVAYDETGDAGNEAYLGTDVTWGAHGAIVGDPNTAIHLSGTQGLDVPYGFDFAGNLPYSLEGWVNLDTPLDGNYRHLFAKDETIATGREEYGVFLQANAGLVFERYVTGTSVHADGPAPLVGQWSYVVATYDGAQLLLYSDGNLVANATDGRAQASKNVPEYLGCKSFNYVSVQGSLDEFAIYGYALSAAQVTAHWAASGR